MDEKERFDPTTPEGRAYWKLRAQEESAERTAREMYADKLEQANARLEELSAKVVKYEKERNEAKMQLQAFAMLGIANLQSISLHDYFAAHALTGIASAETSHYIVNECELAYEYADRMLDLRHEREQQKEKMDEQ